MYWLAPGDDSLTGRATAYDLRYSLEPITSASFLFATRVPGLPKPKPAGSAESFVVTNLIAGFGYYFAIKTVDEASNWSGISNLAFSSAKAVITGVGGPRVAWISAPWPNPVRGVAHWSYSMLERGPLEIMAFDLVGRRICRITDDNRAAGTGEVTWNLVDDDGRAVAPGVYMIRSTLGHSTSVNRLVVTR